MIAVKEQKAVKVAVYSRKSRFTGKGESIENQIELCKEYIRFHYDAEMAKSCLIYEDEGFSGGNLERPRFKEMMRDADKGRFQAIIVYRLDRISRNIGDFAGLIERLNEKKISFISIKEQFDTRSPMGRAMMYIASVFSQLERETIAERIRDNMQELAKTGRWLGGTTPTGYRSENVSRINIDGKVKKACRLKQIPDEAWIVRQIFEKYIENGSLADTEDYLKQEGIQTKKGNPFSRFSIKGILTNPVYMAADEAAYEYLVKLGAELMVPREIFAGGKGVMVYNRTLQRPGKGNLQRNVREWIIAPGEHESIVTGECWVKVQRELESHKRNGARSSVENQAMLSGLIYCAGCDSPMRAKLSGKIDSTGKRSFVYLCTGKEKTHRELCRMENIKGCSLDAQICKTLTMLPEESAYFIELLERELLARDREGNKQNEKKRILQRQEQNLEKQIERLIDVMKEGEKRNANIYLMEQIEELHIKKEKMHSELLKFGQEQDAAIAERRNKTADAEKLCDFGRLFAEIEVKKKRKMLQKLIKRVEWDGENAHVYIFSVKDGIDNKLPFGYT